MKKIYIIAALLILASCWADEVQQNQANEIPVTPEAVVEQTVEVESEDTDNSQEDEASELTEDVSKPEDDEVQLERGSSESDSLSKETPAEEINNAVEELETATEDTSKTQTIDATYNNAKGPVDMKVTYTTDNGKITAIWVSATTYDVSNFNNEIQSLVGSTLEDAAEYKTGSSLTGDAFKKAIKTQL